MSVTGSFSSRQLSPHIGQEEKVSPGVPDSRQHHFLWRPQNGLCEAFAFCKPTTSVSFPAALRHHSDHPLPNCWLQARGGCDPAPPRQVLSSGYLSPCEC